VLSRGRLLDKVEIVPAVFTPNGDQINDIARLNYTLLSVDVPRLLQIAVYDLSGQLVRLIHDAPERNGRYEDKAWDGRNAQGQLVPPGLYIIRLAIEGDAQQDQQSQLVGVAH
jgi:flagellar hook assembly protein FlgD